MPEFKNVQNKPYATEDGIIWNSRSVAVVGHIYCETPENIYILIGKRGPKGDMPGKYNLPCGYLDWNENLAEALCREMYEEAGLDLSTTEYYTKQMPKSDMHQPWFVNSQPNENRQNVAMHMVYGFKADVLPALTTEHAEEGEVELVEWIAIDELYMTEKEFAFNHLDRLKHSYNYLINEK